jgi:transketolase
MDYERVRMLTMTAATMRKLALETIRTAGSGHIGGSFSSIEILTALYYEVLRIDPQRPDWAERDRLVLSKGHCTPALYSALAMRGYFPVERLRQFRRIDAQMSGHAEMRHVPGVDMSTGSLGQGFSAALGMALAGKMFKSPYRVYAILGDGELEEGQIWEAAMAAGFRKLDNLIAIVDNNGLQLDGTLEEVMNPKPIDKKFEAFGWDTITVDGHDIGQLVPALRQAGRDGKPLAVIAKTVKGKGVSFMENGVKWHGGHPTPAEFEKAFDELDQSIARWEGTK